MSAIVSKILILVVGIGGAMLIVPCIFCLFISQIITEATMTPEDTFRSSVNKTIPDSVEIIDYQADLIGVDDSYWVHFTISSKDLIDITQNGSYEYTFAEIESEEWKRTFIGIHPPEWWDIESMSEDDRFYKCSNTEREYFCDMFINEAYNEVYFVYGTI